MCIKKILILFICFFPFLLRGQTSQERWRKSDSLITLYKSIPVREDTSWLALGPKLIGTKVSTSRHPIIYPMLKAYLSVAKKVNSPEYMVWCYGELGRMECISTKEKLLYNDSLLMVAPRLTWANDDIFQAINFTTQFYAQNRLFVKEIESQKIWGNLAVQIKDAERVLIAKSALAWVYQRAGMTELSKNYLFQSLGGYVDTSQNMIWWKLQIYVTLGEVYEIEHKLDSARYYYLRAYNYQDSLWAQKPQLMELRMKGYCLLSLTNFLLSNNELDLVAKYLDIYKQTVEGMPLYMDHRGYYLECQGKYYLAKKQYQEALDIYQQSEERNKQFGGSPFTTYFGKGKALHRLNRPDEAVEYYQKGYDFAIQDMPYYLNIGGLLEICDSLANVHQQLGNQKEAIFFLQKSREWRQERMDQTSIKDFAKYELAQHEQKNALLAASNQSQTQLLYGALVAILGIVFFLLFSLYQLRARRKLYQQLEVEKHKSELLLLNILPEEIAGRLKANPRTIADAFDAVSVIFIDIVGFTNISVQQSPARVVEILNEIFVFFDRLTDQYGLEKIKTIGDCFMAVSGLPAHTPDHLERCINLGLAVLKAKDQFQVDGEPIQFRIGIETGPVVAGIIGEKRFLYDLWGDAVNTASRMESNGLPNAIQTTDKVYQLMHDKYHFQERGLIEVKGKGLMRTWLLKNDE